MAYMEPEATMDKLVCIKICADGKDALVSNQGQALDGYSELANYRDIIQKYADGLRGE